MTSIFSHSATHLLPIELIRLLIVGCGMLVHSSSMAMWSCRILAGTGTRCRIWRSRASQTCSMGDMSSEYAGHARTGMFSASRNCVQILENSLVMQTNCCRSCPGGWSQMILEVKMLDVEVLGWCGYTWSAVVAGWMYCQILWNAFGDGLW